MGSILALGVAPAIAKFPVMHVRPLSGLLVFDAWTYFEFSAIVTGIEQILSPDGRLHTKVTLQKPHQIGAIDRMVFSMNGPVENVELGSIVTYGRRTG